MYGIFQSKKEGNHETVGVDLGTEGYSYTAGTVRPNALEAWDNSLKAASYDYANTLPAINRYLFLKQYEDVFHAVMFADIDKRFKDIEKLLQLADEDSDFVYECAAVAKKLNPYLLEEAKQENDPIVLAEQKAEPEKEAVKDFLQEQERDYVTG